MLRKNEEITAPVTGYTSEGLGVLRAPDGETIFVPDAIAGEVARVRIEHVGRNAAYGRIVQLVTVSPHRVDRACPLGRRCGGCAFWHMDYEEELRLKSQRVRDALTRIGGGDPGEVPILGAETVFHYRGKAQYPVAPGQDGPAAGFYRARTHEVLPVERCRIQAEAAELAREAVVRWMRRFSIPAWDEERRRGLVRHIHVRAASGTGQTLVCVVCTARPPHQAELVSILRASVPGLKTILWSRHSGKGNVVLGGEIFPLYGDGTIEEQLCGLRFRLSARSFFQVNRAQAERLYELVRSFAGPAETALDLYCGTGSITLCLARQTGRVYGVESVVDAVADARENAARNGIENAEFFCADAGEAAARFAAAGEKPEVIVVDPPRKGLSAETADAVKTLAPERVVYVSCDPATLARDVKRLAPAYQLVQTQAVDMFPRCAHVETVVLLSKGEIDSQKVRVEFSLEDMDMSGFRKGATYDEIKACVLEKFGLKVSSLYISQVKRKCGLEVGENYNLSKAEGTKQPQCPLEKEEAIRTALAHFGII